jgi:hypothetical protein
MWCRRVQKLKDYMAKRDAIAAELDDAKRELHEKTLSVNKFDAVLNRLPLEICRRNIMPEEESLELIRYVKSEYDRVYQKRKERKKREAQKAREEKQLQL